MIEWIQQGKGLVAQAATAQERALMKGHLKLMEVEVAGLKDSAIPNGLKPIEATLTFPEDAIRLPDVQTVGMSNGEMERLADATRGLSLGTWGRDILKRAPTTSKEPLTLSPVILGNSRAMGIRDEYPTTKQVWEKAKKFGDRVTAEEMLQIAIEAAKGNIQVEIGKPLVGIMEPVADSDGTLDTLYVVRHKDGLFLHAVYAASDDQWDPVYQFVVSSRK
jgi:hypothetical protein